MFEEMTYEAILARMLDRIPANFDKREGSVLYDALAPAALELKMVYLDLGMAMQETFADTASREYLIRRASERGIAPYPASYACLKGTFVPADVAIAPGERFSCGELDYVVVDKISDGEYQLRCETAGSIGNKTFGTLVPVNYIKGLERCELTELLVPGEDEEETEHLRQRYFNTLTSQAFGGNVADYKEKTGAIPGVGGVKVYPAWEGGGTVKLVVISSEYLAPSAILVQAVQETVDPPADSGKGYGIAPIGHQVTVAAVEEAAVDLELQLVYQDGFAFGQVRASIEETVDAYFHELNQTWANSDCIVVRASRLESRILEIAGILDITGTKLNGKTGNIVLGADEIVKRGTVNEAGS